MVKEITITLDDDIVAFVDKQVSNGENKGSRSVFINTVLRELKNKCLQEELKAAYMEDSKDDNYRKEVAVWDVTVGDGIG